MNRKFARIIAFTFLLGALTEVTYVLSAFLTGCRTLDHDTATNDSRIKVVLKEALLSTRLSVSDNLHNLSSVQDLVSKLREDGSLQVLSNLGATRIFFNGNWSLWTNENPEPKMIVPSIAIAVLTSTNAGYAAIKFDYSFVKTNRLSSDML